ncbi:MAG: DUF262 domain-containing protein [Candidatus Peribacteraceae bacterium]
MANITNSQERLEEEIFPSDDDKEMVPPPDIFAYNELRSCSDLDRMYRDGTLVIQPEFQRNDVWTDSERTRFVDSLIKQLPIPSMCFSLDFKAQKWQVIDGLQRMFTITKFLGQDDWRLSKIPDVNPKIGGKTVGELKRQSPDLFKRVQNLTIPITIIRCDYEKPEHTEYLFTIFHRLNTGGVKLTSQEIRNCIFAGTLNTFLKSCAKDEKWIKLFKLSTKMITRMRDSELVLRFFAFSENYKHYSRLASFLNDYMKENRHVSEEKMLKMQFLFDRVLAITFSKILTQAPEFNQRNVVFKETVLFGIGQNIAALEKASAKDVQAKYSSLTQHESMNENNLTKAVMDKKKVLERMEAAKKAFSASGL